MSNKNLDKGSQRTANSGKKPAEAAEPASILFTPIGVFRCAQQRPYDAARQGALARGNPGRVVLHAGQNFQQALRDLEGFSHVWLIFHFHQNSGWKPLVMPPRGDRKVGVFASRAPYRPNPIGLSCVRLVEVRGRTVHVADHDLLDGTPILDIKPYIPYADSIPDARTGWLEALEAEAGWTVRFGPPALQRLRWLEAHGVANLELFLARQLLDAPLDGRRKRVKPLGGDTWEIAYRTWRARFTVYEADASIWVESVYSGYSIGELCGENDPHGDKAVHRAFRAAFPPEDG